MGRIVIDESCYPVYLVVHEGTVTDNEFVAYLDEMAASMYRPDSGPRLMIQDGSAAVRTTARQHCMQTEWLRAHVARIGELNMGTAFVASSPLVRGALTAALWLHRLPMPHKVVSTMTQALDWLEPIGRARDLHLSTEVREGLLGVRPLPSLRPFAQR